MQLTVFSIPGPIKLFSLLVFGLIAFSSASVAQDTVLNVRQKGKLDSVQSAVLDQKRFFEVFLPEGYKPGSDTKYDVLYVLDGGNWNTGLILRTQTFVEGQGYMPSTIVVSVMGIDRNKDLTPTHLASLKTSGGAQNFLSFIKTELIPYINKNYPSNNDNTLWGHSFGGLFALYALFTEPGLFKSIIAVDPSIWWDNMLLAKMAANRLAAFEIINTTVFISGREGIGMNEMKVDSLHETLKQKAPRQLNWKVVAYPDETHSSVRFKSTYDGLKFTYSGLTSDIQFHPMNGILAKDKPAKIFYFDDTTGLRYTLDGSMPDRSSPQVKKEIDINGDATVTYRKFSNRSKYDKVTTGKFVVEKLPAPILKPKNIEKGGFRYSYFEGDWEFWPDITKLKAAKTGITDSTFNIENLPRTNKYALLIEGMMEVKEDGYYIFIFDADKNSKLFLANKKLIEWDGNYVRRTFSYLIPLSKGFYPIRLEYLHNNKDFNLQWSYLTPSTMESKDTRPIPVELQYRSK